MFTHPKQDETMEEMRERFAPAKEYIDNAAIVLVDDVPNVVRSLITLGTKCYQLSPWEIETYVIRPTIFEIMNPGQISPIVPPCYEGE